jgi:hypothetical protein
MGKNICFFNIHTVRSPEKYFEPFFSMNMVQKIPPPLSNFFLEKIGAPLKN